MLSGQRLFRTVATLALSAGIVAAACAAPAHTDGAFSAAAPQKKKSKVPEEKDPRVQCERGAVAMRYGLTDEAVKYGLQAVALDPEHFDGWNLLGTAYYTKGDFAKSAEAYEKAAAIKPGAADVQRNLGLAYVELKETEKAEAALKRALDSDDAEAAYQMGKLCYNAKRYDEALQYALTAIRQDGKSARAYNLKGVTLNQLGRYAEAAGSFQAGIVLAPDDVGLRINMGIAYMNAGDPAKAKAVLEAVLPKIEDPAIRSQVESYIKSIKDAGN
ncbi:MAG: tetratricopeptide repeat protein [Candidatus Aminicenantes bacterium]|nr:tetratricopeptide repeat protein [Candidatus Aminicenantes bacterium]